MVADNREKVRMSNTNSNAAFAASQNLPASREEINYGGINQAGLAAMLVLRCRAGTGSQANQGRGPWWQMAGMAKRTWLRGIRQLIEAGHVERIERGRGRVDYRILVDLSGGRMARVELGEIGELTGTQLLALMAVRVHEGESGWVYPGNRRLGEIAGCGRRAMQDQLRSLRRKGMIGMRERGAAIRPFSVREGIPRIGRYGLIPEWYIRGVGAGRRGRGAGETVSQGKPDLPGKSVRAGAKKQVVENTGIKGAKNCTSGVPKTAHEYRLLPFRQNPYESHTGPDGPVVERSAGADRGMKSENRPPGGRPEEPRRAGGGQGGDRVPAGGRQGAEKRSAGGGIRGPDVRSRVRQLLDFGFDEWTASAVAWRESNHFNETRGEP